MPSPNSAAIASGNATYAVNLLPSYAFNSPVTFTATVVPSGPTASFNPTTLTGSGQTTLTISGAAAGNYSITVTGTCTTGPCVSSLAHSSTVTLAVGSSPNFSLGLTSLRDFVLQGNSSTPAINVAVQNGFNSAVNFSPVDGLPSGAIGAVSPSSVTGAGSATLAISVGAGTAVGTYPVTITGTSGSLTHTAVYTLVVTSQDFTMTASPVNGNQVFIIQDNATPYTAYDISINRLNGLSSPITFSTSGQPSCVAPSTGTNFTTGQPQIGVFTGACTDPAVVGHYPITITGAAASGPIHTYGGLDMFLVDYRLSASPSTLMINKGGNANSTVTVTRNPTNGLGGSIHFNPPTVSPTTSNVTATYTTANPANVNITVNISVSSHAASGTYVVTVTGTPNGTVSPARPTTITVTVP